VVNCTNFENWRGFAVTGGSNPSLSEFYVCGFLFSCYFCLLLFNNYNTIKFFILYLSRFFNSILTALLIKKIALSLFHMGFL
jgi:hypothetical protein